MKIRTDFVTNSSSSSFVVKLIVESTAGEAFELQTYECQGDYQATGIEFAEKDKDGKTRYRGYVSTDIEEYLEKMSDSSDLDEGEVENLYEATEFLRLGPGSSGVIDLESIHGSKNVEELLAAIKRPINGIYYNKQAGEYCDAHVQLFFKNTISAFNELLDHSGAIMAEHIKTNDDVQSISASYEFSAWGEYAAWPSEIIESLFGWDEGRKMNRVISDNDKENAVAILKDLPCLNRFAEESIESIIDFVNECEVAPDNCVVVHTLDQEGKNHLEFTFEI